MKTQTIERTVKLKTKPPLLQKIIPSKEDIIWAAILIASVIFGAVKF